MRRSAELTLPPLPAKSLVERMRLHPALAMAVIFAVVVGLLFLRWNKAGLELPDFRDAIYYPVVALLDGNNPYDTANYLRNYPVSEEFPPYLPGFMSVHLPLGWMPVKTAELLYLASTVLFMLCLAYVTLAMCRVGVTPARVFGLGTVLVVSPPGYLNLALGQCTVPVVIATYLALRYAREREWLAALGLGLALLKPTYGAPLGALLFAGGNWAVALAGGAIAVLLSTGPTVALMHASGGASGFLASVRQSYGSFVVAPSSSVTAAVHRVDSVILAADLLRRAPTGAEEIAVTFIVLGLGALAVWRLRDGSNPERLMLSNSVACLTILVCTYHQSYDLLVAVLPLMLLATGRWSGAGMPASARWAALALIGFPMTNYLMSPTVMNFLGVGHAGQAMLSALNGVAAFAAWLVVVVVALRYGGPPLPTTCKARQPRH